MVARWYGIVRGRGLLNGNVCFFVCLFNAHFGFFFIYSVSSQFWTIGANFFFVVIVLKLDLFGCNVLHPPSTIFNENVKIHAIHICFLFKVALF